MVEIPFREAVPSDGTEEMVIAHCYGGFPNKQRKLLDTGRSRDGESGNGCRRDGRVRPAHTIAADDAIAEAMIQ